MIRFVVALGFIALLQPVARSQILSGTVTPPVVAPGQTVSLSITALQSFVLPNCMPSQILQGGPSGPLVGPPTGCPGILFPLVAGQSVLETWLVPTTTVPGSYWMRVDVLFGGFFLPQYFCAEVRSNVNQGLTLLELTPPRLGTIFQMGLGDPTLPGFPYVAAASMTSTMGLNVGTMLACIDPDPVFHLSWPNPHPSIFGNFQGSLDASGSATLFMALPNVPSLINWPLKVQVVGLAPNQLVLSNALSLTLLP